MTTPKTGSRTAQARKPFGFPDPPEDPEDKMTNFQQMADTGALHHLKQHLGNPDSTLVAGEKYLALAPTRNLVGVRYPDLLVAFGVNPGAYYASNAYVIEEQGKPPDLVLEVASRSSGREDVGPKRETYAGLLVPEYWRFDETGRYHGVKLAGDRLVKGEYVPIEIEELASGSLQGYSAALDLHLRWEPSGLPPLTVTPARGLERGELVFYDPATGSRIATLEDERARADSEQARADAEREARIAEREARITAEAELAAAEARIRQLEERLQQ